MIAIESGCLWVTLERDPRDIVLVKDMRFEIDRTGRTVIVASRIADEAKGGQVLVSSLLMQLCESSGEFVFDEGHEVTLKGLSQPYVVHALKWEGGD